VTHTYVVECYWPGVDELQLTEAVERIPRNGDASWMNSILIPADEIVLCVVEAPSAEAVRASARRAGLPAERIVTCVQVGTPVHAAEGKEPR
jgi:Protein of unknown function (DUF4242)